MAAEPASPAASPVRRGLITSDGVRIDACHDDMAADGDRRQAGGPEDDRELAIVVAHGFTGSWQRPAVRRAVTHFARRAGVLSFDFRGHGASTGASTVGDREVFDLAAVVDWARELGYRRIATVGFSMGASVAIRHAALVGEVDAVAAVSGPARWYYRGTPPMRRVHWVIERRLGRLVSRLALRTRIATGGWDPLPEPPHAVVSRIAPTPLLIVHGDADRYFPVEHAEQLYAEARQPKELWLEPGFGHAENAAGDDLLDRIAGWLAGRSGPGVAGAATQGDEAEPVVEAGGVRVVDVDVEQHPRLAGIPHQP